MRIAGIEFKLNDETLAVDIITASGLHTYTNPLEAWGVFIHKVDAAGRHKLGDLLENRGYNRYTGVRQSPVQTMAPVVTSPTIRTSCENCQMGGTCLARDSLGSCVNGIPIDPGKEE